jgi:hypothetical protein
MGLRSFERLDSSEKQESVIRLSSDWSFAIVVAAVELRTSRPFQCAGIILGAHLGEQGTISQIKKKGACPGNAGQAPDDSNLVFRRFGLESSDFRYGMAKVRPVTTAAWLRAAVLFHGIW